MNTFFVVLLEPSIHIRLWLVKVIVDFSAKSYPVKFIPDCFVKSFTDVVRSCLGNSTEFRLSLDYLDFFSGNLQQYARQDSNLRPSV